MELFVVAACTYFYFDYMGHIFMFILYSIFDKIPHIVCYFNICLTCFMVLINLLANDEAILCVIYLILVYLSYHCNYMIM